MRQLNLVLKRDLGPLKNFCVKNWCQNVTEEKVRQLEAKLKAQKKPSDVKVSTTWEREKKLNPTY